MMHLLSSLFQHKSILLLLVVSFIIGVIQAGSDDFIIHDSNWPSHNHATSLVGQASEHAAMVALRQGITDQMWTDHQSYNGN
jgi:hypothetical protein